MNLDGKSASETVRPSFPAMGRGARALCPACGEGTLYSSYLKIVDDCDGCGQELHHQRADDAPPYFTIFVVGHIVVPLILIVETTWHPDYWVHMALWLPLIIVMSLVLLPIIKGAVVGLQWAQRMHGFETAPPPRVIAKAPDPKGMPSESR